MTVALSGILPLALAGLTLGAPAPTPGDTGAGGPDLAVAVGEDVDLDPATLERGLRTRVAELDGWSVSVRSGDAASPGDDRVYVELVRPDGSRDGRELPVSGDTPEARARGLASELALIMDTWEPPMPIEDSEPEGDVEPDPAPDPETRRGFLLVGGGLWAARSAVVAPGVALGGGALVLDDHLMVRLDAAWHVARRDTLALHGIRVAAGLGGGTSLLDRRLWVGGLLAPGLDLLVADDAETRTLPGFGGALTALVQGRLGPRRRLVLEAQTGADLRLPPVRVRGQDATLRWRPAAWTASVAVGIVL